MRKQRLFLDTSFIQAILNRRDQYHSLAMQSFYLLEQNEICLHDGILIELGNTFASSNRKGIADWIQSCWRANGNPMIRVIPLEQALIQRAMKHYYAKYRDKNWGLMDCVSFTVMKQHKLTTALTFDLDFRQAGFVTLPLK